MVGRNRSRLGIRKERLVPSCSSSASVTVRFNSPLSDSYHISLAFYHIDMHRDGSLAGSCRIHRLAERTCLSQKRGILRHAIAFTLETSVAIVPRAPGQFPVGEARGPLKTHSPTF